MTECEPINISRGTRHSQMQVPNLWSWFYSLFVLRQLHRPCGRASFPGYSIVHSYLYFCTLLFLLSLETSPALSVNLPLKTDAIRHSTPCVRVTYSLTVRRKQQSEYSMPHPDLPPTPAPSTDIVGQQRRLSKDPQKGFVLPPPAMSERQSPDKSTSADSTTTTSASSYHPVSPVSPTVKPKSNSPRHKRTSSGAKKPLPRDDFQLPPPPTRARKIIHVQPKPSDPVGTPAPSTKTPSKRKGPSASSAAGRKIARRTAHSVIERRRRSKMNEEFDTLKNMIPACEGQEMHKLAILQASIDYTRYLEDCIKDLKGHHQNSLHDQIPRRGYPQRAKSVLTSPFVAPQDQYRRSSTAPSIDSPSIAASSSRDESVIEESSTTAPTPTLLSPAFHAIHFSPSGGMSRPLTNPSNKVSPNMLPQAAIEIDQDYHDATTALMMLNNDRRGLGVGQQGSHEDNAREGGELGFEPEAVKRRPTGMSVKDLLSA